MNMKMHRQPQPNADDDKIAEYEKVIREQKERIVVMRDENRALQKKIDDYRSKEQVIAAAMINAERASGEVIKNAKRAAGQIMHDAEEHALRQESMVNSYTAQLKELDKCCEAILCSIRQHLDKSQSTLGIVIGGRQ